MDFHGRSLLCPGYSYGNGIRDPDLRSEGGGGDNTYWIIAHLHKALGALDGQRPNQAREYFDQALTYNPALLSLVFSENVDMEI